MPKGVFGCFMASFVPRAPLRTVTILRSGLWECRASTDRNSKTTSAAPRIKRTRRDILLFSTVSSLLAFYVEGASKVLAYSSPYAPGKQRDDSLPDRLYESQVSQVVRTASGLQYFDIAQGSGEVVREGSTVSCYYTSRLSGLYGTKLDSSFDHPSDPPFQFRVGAPDVVPGFNEAVVGMRAGGKRRAVLPASIAYTSPASRPAVTEFFAKRRLLSVLDTNRDASIVFDIELLKVK